MIEKLDPKMEYVKISITGNEEAECLDFEALHIIEQITETKDK